MNNTWRKFKQYSSKAGLYLFATILGSSLSILINPLLAKNLSPEDYGIIGYYQGLSNFFSPIIGYFILDFYLRKFYLLKEDERDNLKGTMVKMYLYFSSIITLLCIGSLFLYMKYSSISIPFMPYAPLMMLQLNFSFLMSFQLSEFRIQGRAKNFTYVTILNSLLSVTMTLLMVVLIKWEAFGKLLSALVTSLIMFVITLIYYRKSLSYKIDNTLIKEFFKFATPLVGAGVLGFFSNGYDRFFLEKQNNINELGIYSVGFQTASYLGIFATAIKSTFQPDVFKAIAEKNLTKIIKINLMTIVVISFFVVLFIIFCPYLIYLLTAGRYVSSTIYAQIIALSIITSNIYYLISQVTFASGLSNLTLINKIIGASLTVLLFYLMIPEFGAIGAAWSMVISFAFSSITNVILLFINKNKFLK